MKLSLLKLNIAVLGLTLSSLAAAKINSQPKLGTVSSTVSIDKLDLESKIEFEQPPGSGGTTSVDRYKSTPSQKIQDYKKQEFKKIDLQKLARGGVHGGGGDASEIGINEIRGDILKWIEKGGPSAFKEFPLEINLETYIERMTQVLQPHAVVIGFVNTQQENTTNDPEMRVYVNGQPKQCRGFVSEKDQRPHILCNSDRYPKGGADQYKLIHHEFAGLVGVERNDGASSDYVFSNQLTDFLVPEVVYRLALKPQVTDSSLPGPYNCDEGKTISASDPGIIMCDLNGPEGTDNFLIRVPDKTGRCSKANLNSITGFYIDINTDVMDGGRTVSKSLSIRDTNTNAYLYQVGMDKHSNTASFSVRLTGGKAFYGICRPYN